MAQYSEHSKISTLPVTDIPDYPDFATLRDRILYICRSKLLFSDLVINQDSPILLRQPSGPVAVSDEIVSREDLQVLFSEIEPQWESLIKIRAFDRAKDLDDMRIRLNCYTSRSQKRLGCVIRRFGREPMSLDEIGLKPNCQAFATFMKGLVLIIGDTSQGKSTTIAALLDQINKTRGGHILTIEDPIEGTIPNRRCIVTQREVGPEADVVSYEFGAKDALRQRPDIVLIGEIREAPEARASVALAEAGPLVFATMHAKSTEVAVEKLVGLLGDTPAAARTVANILKGTICQALLPSTKGDGWHLATECMTVTPDLAKCIETRNFAGLRPLIERGARTGSHSMNAELFALYKTGQITREEAHRSTTDPEKFDMIFGPAPTAPANP